MNWLLRFFPEFRHLQDEAATLRLEAERLRAENAILNDRLEAAQKDREWLQAKVDTTMERYDAAVANERAQYQTHINVQWQKNGWGKPYPEAYSLPESALPQPMENPVVPAPVPVSELVRRKKDAFIADFNKS